MEGKTSLKLHCKELGVQGVDPQATPSTLSSIQRPYLYPLS